MDDELHEYLERENAKLKDEIRRLKLRLASLRKQLDAQKGYGQRDWEFNQDYLPYQEDDRRD